MDFSSKITLEGSGNVLFSQFNFALYTVFSRMVEVEKIEPIRSWRKENKLTSIEFKARLKGKFIQWFNLLCPDYGLEDKIPIKKKILNPLMEIE